MFQKIDDTDYLFQEEICLKVNKEVVFLNFCI